MKDTVQVSATMDKEVRDGVVHLAREEDRSFSKMLEILAAEALLAREESKTK